MNKLIIDTLKPTGVPVAFLSYNNTADTYIVFLEYHQASFINADDEEKVTKHFYQVDVFSRDATYLTVVKDVKTRMKNAGFGRMFESETYDDDMKMFRKLLRFSYLTEEEK